MGNKGTHNKAPIVGLCNRLYTEKIRFFVCAYTPHSNGNDCSQEERDLQDIFGNINIDGIKDYRSAMRHMRAKLGITEGSIEGVLLDLMETHGDVLNHALGTASTADLVEALFKSYWKKTKKR